MLLMADPRNTEEYRVRWNAHTEAITETFSHLYQSKTITDVSLSTEGGIIKAHRVVLSVCSMYFRKLFTSIEDSHPVIVLPNISYDHMQYLMQFMYLGEAQVKSAELKEVLNVAQILQIKGFSTDLAKNSFSPPDREASRRLLNSGFGMIPPISHQIRNSLPPMLPPGLVINPAFSLPNSLPLHNLVSLSQNMVSPNLDPGFGYPNNTSVRSMPISSSLLPHPKKCVNARKKVIRCGTRLNGIVKQPRLLSYRNSFATKLDNIPFLTTHSAATTENEPTDLSMPPLNITSPSHSTEFPSITPKKEVGVDASPKMTSPDIQIPEEHIDIVDLSPKPLPISINGQDGKPMARRKSCATSESDSSSSHSNLDDDITSKSKRTYKEDIDMGERPEDQQIDHEKSDDCSSDTIAGPSWALSKCHANGEAAKYEKPDEAEEDESLHALNKRREGFWKSHMKDGILNPYLGGAVPQLTVEARSHNFSSSLTAFYSSAGSPVSWNNRSVSPPVSTADIPFHLRSNECSKCGRLYKTRKGLKHHIKNECGVEPRFQCSHCDWRFKQKAHLLRHMARKHTL